MRTMMALVVAGALTAAAAPARAADEAQVRFSGIKLVDMKARTPEQTVNVLVAHDNLSVIDAAANTAIRTFDYSGLAVTHTFASTPPAEAGNPNTATTQPMAMPMYFGRDPRNWLTLTSGSQTVVLRVSPHVYEKFKSALGEHNVTVSEAGK